MPFVFASVLAPWGNVQDLVRDDGKEKVNLKSSAFEISNVQKVVSSQSRVVGSRQWAAKISPPWPAAFWRVNIAGHHLRRLRDEAGLRSAANVCLAGRSARLQAEPFVAYRTDRKR